MDCRRLVSICCLIGLFSVAGLGGSGCGPVYEPYRPSVVKEKRPKVRKAFDIREESTAVTAMSVVSPENLYVWNTPALVDADHVIYSAKQWITGKRSDTVSIWKTKTTGGVATKLVPAGDVEYLWAAKSHSGASRIFFTLSCSIYSSTKSGTGGRMKHASTGYCDYWPVPFPGASKLLFSSCEDGRDCWFEDSNYIWTMNEDGTEIIQLRTGSAPCVSSDGRKIAFGYEGDLWIMNPDGSGVTNLSPSGKYKDGFPNFSPDGKRIVFVRSKARKDRDGFRNSDIWVIGTDGINLIQLTMNPAIDNGPVWGGDGFIYFMTNRGPLVSGEFPVRVWRMKLVESTSRPTPKAF